MIKAPGGNQPLFHGDCRRKIILSFLLRFC
nr:MAG TPA: hypothetical protein [Caudoviricetes sp.]